MQFRSVDPDALVWKTRPHADGEPARRVAELSEALGATHVRANIWRYEPGAKGRRHVHAEQGRDLRRPERHADANHGGEDLVVYASGYPPDHGAAVLDSAIP